MELPLTEQGMGPSEQLLRLVEHAERGAVPLLLRPVCGNPDGQVRPEQGEIEQVGRCLRATLSTDNFQNAMTLLPQGRTVDLDLPRLFSAKVGAEEEADPVGQGMQFLGA